MSRICAITHKRPLSGHNVSHANNKTKRKYYPNLQQLSFWSETLGRKISLKASPKVSKTITSKGGFDNWLLEVKDCNLTSDLKSIRKTVLKRSTLN